MPRPSSGVFEFCQAAEQELITKEELEKIRRGSLLGTLVVGTGYLYNPNGRKILSYREVKQWEHGHAIVGPDEVYPQTYIRINGDMYYLDMNALTRLT